MQRILIVGNGGAGKTVLANRLGRLLAIPVTHLDALRYDSSWNVVPEERFVAAQREIITAPSWIIVLLTELNRTFPQLSDGFSFRSLRLS